LQLRAGKKNTKNKPKQNVTGVAPLTENSPEVVAAVGAQEAYAGDVVANSTTREPEESPHGQSVITSGMAKIYRDDFCKFDKNGNGALDGDEIKELAKFQLGSDDEEQVAKLIRQMDINDDGKITFEEYMDRILGLGWVEAAEDAQGNDIVIGRTYCTLKQVKDCADKVYDEMKKIPLICPQKDAHATVLTTAWQYLGGCTTLDTKMLVGLAMNEGSIAAWDRIATAAEGAMKAGRGNTLVLSGRNGATDICGIAKETSADAEATLAAVFHAESADTKDHTKFPALKGLELGDVKPEFRVAVVTEFLEEDVCDFFQWGQLPLDKCHMVVVTE